MAEPTKKTTGVVSVYKEKKNTKSTKNEKFNLTMQLFGLPYQFLPSVDQRVPEISKTVGRKYIENIIMDSKIVTIIPGTAEYLPGTKDKVGFTNAFMSAASGNVSELSAILKENPSAVRFYDFKSNYTKVMARINTMCHIAAGFLDLNGRSYQVNGAPVDLREFDWRNYRWNGKKYKSVLEGAVTKAGSGFLSAIKNIGKAVKATATGMINTKSLKGGIDALTDFLTEGKSESDMESWEEILKGSNFIQFYCGADTAHGSDNMSNSTEPSVIKSALEQGSSAMKNITFGLNTAGAEGLTQLGDSFITQLDDIFGEGSTISSATGGILGRLMQTGKSVIRGENIILPDIYSGSSNSKQYTLSFKFKALYGNTMSLYADVIAPVLHCIGIAYPVGTSGNSYKSPPLLKVYKKGEWTVSLGIASSISIEKDDVQEAWSVDGLAMEVKVDITIQDLYPDITVTEANDPISFMANSSLIEYIASMCGVDMTEPQFSKKVDLLWSGSKSFIKSLPSTVVGDVSEKITNVLANFTGL